MASRQLIVVMHVIPPPHLRGLLSFHKCRCIPAKALCACGCGRRAWCSQSCDHHGWSLTGATPIPSAKVSVTCKSNIGQAGFYKVFQANANGYVYDELEGYKTNHALDYPLQSCKVKLVSSPLQKCSLATNVNFGLDSAPLRSEGKSYTSQNYKAVIYAAGPFAFRPAHCPYTNHH